MSSLEEDYPEAGLLENLTSGRTFSFFTGLIEMLGDS